MNSRPADTASSSKWADSELDLNGLLDGLRRMRDGDRDAARAFIRRTLQDTYLK